MNTIRGKKLKFKKIESLNCTTQHIFNSKLCWTDFGCICIEIHTLTEIKFEKCHVPRSVKKVCYTLPTLKTDCPILMK